MAGIFLILLAVGMLVMWKLQRFLALLILSIILVLYAVLLLYENPFLGNIWGAIRIGCIGFGIVGIIYGIRER